MIKEMLVELAEEESPVDSDTGEFSETALAYFLTKRQKTFEFYVNKFVEDVLAYCHRKDFPLPLIFTIVEMILKRFNDILAAEGYEKNSEGLYKKIKMDDTEFEFDTSLEVALRKVDVTELINEKLFNSIKPKLNLYRRVVSL